MASKKTTKKCTGPCGKVKPRTEFNWRNKAKGCVQSHCRDCQSAAQRKYRQSDKGRNVSREYRQSGKGKEAQRKYRQSDEGKEARREYRQSDKGKEALRKYRQSDKGKEAQRKYRQSDEGKEYQRKYRQSPERREAQRERRQSPEGREAACRRSVKRRARKLKQLCECCDPNEREQAYAAGWLGEDCWLCGAPANETDHVIPLAAGKPGDALHCLENFRPICKDCNGSGGKWYTLWPAHLGWDASPGWGEFLQARRVLPVAT